MNKIINVVRVMDLVDVDVIHGRARVKYRCEECKWVETIWWQPEGIVPCPICNVATKGEDQHED